MLLKEAQKKVMLNIVNKNKKPKWEAEYHGGVWKSGGNHARGSLYCRDCFFNNRDSQISEEIIELPSMSKIYDLVFMMKKDMVAGLKLFEEYENT